MKKKWFRVKNYGWGWMPITWQGWGVLGVYIVFVVWNFVRIDSHSHSGSDTLINFIPETFVATILLITICSLTGEKPHWSWGKKK